jgi:hypothetical protein
LRDQAIQWSRHGLRARQHRLHGLDITQPFCPPLEHHCFRDSGAALVSQSTEQLRSFERLRADDQREIRAEYDSENNDECESDDDHMSFSLY